MIWKRASVVFLALSACASAQNINAPPEMNYDRLMRMEMRVIKEDSANQATRFSKRPPNRKLAEKLWDQGKKLGADAVLNVSFSDLETTGLFYAQRRAYGQAVKFLTAEEATAFRESKQTE